VGGERGALLRDGAGIELAGAAKNRSKATQRSPLFSTPDKAVDAKGKWGKGRSCFGGGRRRQTALDRTWKEKEGRRGEEETGGERLKSA